MKLLNFLLASSMLAAINACQDINEQALPNQGTAYPEINSRTPDMDYPSLAPDFSRGFSINNAGVMSGSTKNLNGKVVAFKLSHNSLWLSNEEVSSAGSPVVKITVNDRGDVAGHKLVAGGIAPTLWKDGDLYDLQGLPGYSFAEVFDMNASGEMVGEALNGNYVTPSATRAIVLYNEGPATDIGTLGGLKASAAAINNHGHIVGFSETTSGQTHAFLYRDGVMEDLGTLGGTTSNANAINNSDQIAGRSTRSDGAIRGFLYQEGVMTEIPTLGGSSSVALDINDRGEIVGFARTSSNQIHAFYYYNGIITDLGTLGGVESRAISINNKGDVIGYYVLADASVHAFLYKDGIMIAL